MEIVVALTTDDEKEAWDELYRRWMKNDGKPWDMKEVQFMSHPPLTDFKYCVFYPVT